MHLLYVCVGISIGENIGMLLPEDVPNSAAGDDLQASSTHPHTEGDFCKTTTFLLLPPNTTPPALRHQA